MECDVNKVHFAINKRSHFAAGVLTPPLGAPPTGMIFTPLSGLMFSLLSVKEIHRAEQGKPEQSGFCRVVHG